MSSEYVMTREQLIELARSIVQEIGSGAEAARRLGVDSTYVTKALRVDADSATRDGLLVRIVEELGGWEVERDVRFRVR